MLAKKSLGQHFLKSDRALRDIVDAGDVGAGDIVLEIGPGHGDLTSRLMALAAKVIAVEKDDNLYAELKEKFEKEIKADKLDLIHGDILDFDPENLKFYKDFDYKIVANIPYNITGAIIRKFLSASYQPELMVLLVQKEVAERIVSRDKKESILSLSVKCFGTPHYIGTVKAGSFAPAPKVDSAILLIDNISKNFFTNFSEKTFFELLHSGFKSKRKKLSSNLSNILPRDRVIEVFKELELDPNMRAEDVHIEGWQKISQSI
jgi:16S rRNA (adenine1518-N6/adenine1519-N6)-dimethyltransferase